MTLYGGWGLPGPMTMTRTSGRGILWGEEDSNVNIDERDGQYVRTEDLVTGIPEWVGMLAIRQCVRAGVHDIDYMGGACRKHLLEARLLAAWLAGEIDDPTALVLKLPRYLR